MELRDEQHMGARPLTLEPSVRRTRPRLITTRRLLVLAVVLGLIAAAVLYVGHAPNAITGAIVTSDPDPGRELPVEDVVVSIEGGPASSSVRSDAAGYFSLPLPWHLRAGQKIGLRFTHKDYKPLDVEATADQICIAHLVPVAAKEEPAVKPEMLVSNLLVTYSIGTTRTVNIGHAVRTFQTVNVGNIPCKGKKPCSPDGKWRATEETASLDAGPGNEFRNARVSCIAGPCPFTKVEAPGIVVSTDGRSARVTVLDWSDTATFLLEAEVYGLRLNNELRQLYPLVFGRALAFTLPSTAEGVSIEAELNREKIVFPLGPRMILSWADCQVAVNRDGSGTRVYRCELKAGYRF